MGREHIKVAKFGGSSLADAAHFQKVREIVEADPERRYIVPSAPGKRSPQDEKVTDLLYLCYEEAKHGRPYKKLLEKIQRDLPGSFHGFFSGIGFRENRGGFPGTRRG